MNVRLGVIGARGRLGKSIALQALKTPGYVLAKTFSRTAAPTSEFGIPFSTDLQDLSFDVYIDASLPASLPAHLEAAVSTKRPIVIGCTGLTEMEKKLLEQASHSIPVFYASNFSIGMALLHQLAKKAAQRIVAPTKIELVETHHTGKKDAPSGSALSLSAEIEKSWGQKPSIASIREGEAVGKHDLVFTLDHEQILISHVAHSREAFASGALAAARFILAQKPGLYGMDDLLEPVGNSASK